jgi:hypothetical protein
MHVNENDDGFELYRLAFLDFEGNELACFGGVFTGDAIAFDLPLNSDLVGVYGVKGKKKSFTTFGFIVRFSSDTNH